MVQNLPANEGDAGLIFGDWGRMWGWGWGMGGTKAPWRKKWQSTPVFLSGKAMDRGAWRVKPMGSQKC